MDVLSEKVEQGVVEQRFGLQVDGQTVPGIRWYPEGAKVPRPTILIGHGGTQHKRVPNLLGLARRFVRHLGNSAVALDAPGHGERADFETVERRRQAIQARIEAGPGAVAVRWVRKRPERGSNGIPEESPSGTHSSTASTASTSNETDNGTAFGGVDGDGDRAATRGVWASRARGPRAGRAWNLPGSDRFEHAACGLKIPVLLVLQWNENWSARHPALHCSMQSVRRKRPCTSIQAAMYRFPSSKGTLTRPSSCVISGQLGRSGSIRPTASSRG